jgi:DNA repair exonuclease SbcCD ATPase subunit
MIIFTRITYQNFFAVGNAPIALDLNTHATTLIVGRNGVGKSTVGEAVVFALFGKPLRAINKPQLVNNVNRRDCLVELDFTTGSGSYKVRRGIKPTVFEIFHNGNLIPVPANVDDYQETLESIIKLDYKSFKQVVILGSASFTPFMRLTTGQRRDIIEDLLDIQVFSSMNALAKDDLSTAKSTLDKLTTQRKMLGDQIVMAEGFTSLLEQQNAQALADINTQITQYQTELDTLRIDLQDVNTELAECTRQMVGHSLDACTKKQQQYEQFLVQLKAKLKTLQDDEAFYATNANCPECEQVITEAFKATRLADCGAQKQAEATLAITQCESALTRYRTLTQTAQSHVDEETRLKGQQRDLKRDLQTVNRRIAELEVERIKHAKPVVHPNVDLKDLHRQADQLSLDYADTSKQRVIYDAATQLLKDTGIKTKVVRHYLPIINRLVNHYLNAMDFPILFTFDESFNETMKSRHRDEFSYEAFSEGEKKRIDLALLLTWRAVAKLKNSASTNLLILDEVFDSSLDSAGIEEFLKIMATLEAGTNVFVISHRTDQLVDKFEHTLLFEKHKQFSRLK